MRKGLLPLLCSLLLAAGAIRAGAEIWDPTTIQAIQGSSGIGGPIAPPDTVGSVIGIITAFDTFPSGFSFYIQDPLGGPNGGVQVFTGGNNTASTLGLQVGDRVEVEGALSEFSAFTSMACYGGTANGETEIRAKDGDFGSNLIINVLSSGNPLPAFHVGTVNTLRETCTNTTGEEYEGSLVEVIGPMRVVRTNFTGGLGTFRSSLVVDNVLCPPGTLTPCDSLFIDLSTLSFNAVDPGVVGQLVDFVRGVYNQRSRGYRVQARDGNDYGLQAAPKLLRAFAIDDAKYRLVFDRDALILGGSPTTTFDLASFGNVDAVTQVNGVTIDLDVSGTGLSAGDLESVTVTNIASASNPALIETSGQIASFRAGIVTPAMIQTADADSISLTCHDVSQYQRTQLNTTVRGTCTARFDNLYYIQGSTGLRDAVAVFAPPQVLTVGNQYVLAVGVIGERFDETQIQQVVYVADEGAVSLPAPITLPVATMTSVEPCVPPAAESGGFEVAGTNYAEDYECMLVKAEQVKVTTPTGAAPPGGFFDVAGPYFAYTDSINVDDDGTQTYEPVQGNLLDVTGVLHFSFGAFRIQPRDDNDIVLIASDVPLGGSRSVSFSLAANPSRAPRVEFTVPTAARVHLSVFDVGGRKIQTLVSGDYAAGTYTEAWDGRDARGQVVGAGMYFYRLELGGESYEVRGVKLN